ncbi:MAG: tetratricopeptide repeat protein [Bacteroidota bacterium]
MRKLQMIIAVALLSIISCQTKNLQQDEENPDAYELSSIEQQADIVRLLEQNKLGKAERAIHKLFKSDTVSIGYLILKGRLERRKGNDELAEKYYLACLKMDSLFAFAYVGLASIYNLNGDYKKGLQSINKAIQIDSTDMDFYNERSAIYYNMNKYQEAYDDIKKAYLKHPGDEYLIHNMGTALNALNRYEEAIEYLDITHTLNPKEPRNYFDRGIAYYYTDQPEKAIADFRKALKYNDRAIKSDRIELNKIYYMLSHAYDQLNDTNRRNDFRIKEKNYLKRDSIR